MIEGHVADGALEIEGGCKSCQVDLNGYGYGPVTDATNALMACSVRSMTVRGRRVSPRHEPDCDDALDCTADSCDPVTGEYLSGLTTGCLIDGVCVEDGTVEADNPCLVVRLITTTIWAPAPSGTTSPSRGRSAL